MMHDKGADEQCAPARLRASTGRRTEVLVVGGGVSGCACAAGLAARGLSVTVISSALDSVGQPAYGPEVVSGTGAWMEVREVLGALAGALRGVWLAASVAPAGRGGLFAVDRRMLSVETKRALERVPGLRFRQGLVTSVRLCGGVDGGRPSGAVVETAFGEAIEGDAVVIAVGMALGGRVVAGDDALPGGRYGETPSDGLRIALKELGAEFEEVRFRVGPRFLRGGVCLAGGEGRARTGQRIVQGERYQSVVRRAQDEGVEGVRGEVARAGGPEAAQPGRHEGARSGRDEGARPAWRERVEGAAWGKADGGGEAREENGGDALVGLVVSEAVALEKVLGWEADGEGLSDSEARWGGWGSERVVWPPEFPAAPNWTDGLRLKEMATRPGDGEEDAPAVLPDGLATAEVWVEKAGLESAEGCRPASRLQHTVVGQRVLNLSAGGRLDPGAGEWVPVWVTGRASGALTYLESLAAGVGVAEDVAGAVREGLVGSGRDEEAGRHESGGFDTGGVEGTGRGAAGADAPGGRWAADGADQTEEGVGGEWMRP